MTRPELMKTKVGMSFITEVGKSWRELRWLVQDRYEWWKCIFAYAPQEARRKE